MENKHRKYKKSTKKYLFSGENVAILCRNSWHKSWRIRRWTPRGTIGEFLKTETLLEKFLKNRGGILGEVSEWKHFQKIIKKPY